MLALSAQARQLDPTEALTRALGTSSAPSRGATPTLVYTDTDSTSGVNGVYVFNRGTDNGFVVVSADDNARALLGYSDAGSFDPSDILPNLRAWLNGYTRQIAYAAANPAASVNNAVTTQASREKIAPKCTTLWNQDAPYNDQCPKDKNHGYVRSYTGCVATAMAQVMKYHNYPSSGIGSNTYTTSPLDTVLSYDFSNAIFHWESMLDSYTSTASVRQTDAVATLMYACGVSVNMNYSATGSGANSFDVGKALIDYFGYDKGITYENRDWHTAAEWDDIIYHSLHDCGPIVFGGSSSSGGHEFVCDGYNTDGYYHFNWGWGGMSDGYFLLSALDPETQGIGGTDSAYSFEVDAITRICKPNASSKYTYNMTSTYDLSAKDAGNGSILLSGGFFSYSYTTIKSIELGVEINGKYYNSSATQGEVLPYHGCSEYKVPLSSLPAGTYQLRPAFKCEGQDWQPMQRALCTVNTVTITKHDDGTFDTSSDAISISVEDLTTTPLSPDSPYRITAKVKNSGSQAVVGIIHFILKSSSGAITDLGKCFIDAEAGTSTPIEFSSTLSKWLSTGEYTIYVTREANYGYANNQVISESFPVTVTTQSGIEDITPEESDTLSIDIYNVNGMKIASYASEQSLSTAELPAGIYIMVSTHADGHRTSQKYIRR